MSYPTSHVAQLADLFRLMGDVTRLRIVLACLHEAVAVGDIAASLDLSSSLVSHHLRLLKAARIVKSERHGKQMFYSVADHHISGVLKDMLEHIDEPHDDILQDAQHDFHDPLQEHPAENK